ncbi:SagB/ThcOx family dehydrogenase [Salinigranum salinum]|uniref:SagB/ThcOx family dehydrogenase n=1 Tax=Salinigranum salinum TaxID=1364937 RepID=UPI001261367E|nr:SagB/ThcOx family dehydrogenase [Salinigranum salinum]
MSDDRALSRRTVGRLTAGATAAGSLLLGKAFGAVSVDDGDAADGTRVAGPTPTVDLPDPTTDGTVSVESALATRRSRRQYAGDPLSLADLGQLLWAAQGLTAERPARSDLRTAPSAGATYPLELSVVAGDPGVEDLQPGVYRHERSAHRLVRRREGEFRAALQRAALDQQFVGAAPAAIVVTAVDARTIERYGQRGESRYVPMEAGHVGENLYLQAETRGLATVAVGAFRDDAVRSVLDLPDDHRPLYVFPVGTRRDTR